MDQEQDKIAQAIAIASDASQADLHQEALAYLSAIEQNVNETWRLALILFTEQDDQGRRKYLPQVRFFGLRVLDLFLDNRYEPLDQATFQTLQQALVTYIQSEYIFGTSELSASFLRNKFAHTLTLFFLCSYIDQWPTFFFDLFTLIRPNDSASTQPFNRHVSLLFFHILIEISEEVADQSLKASRTYNPIRVTRDTRVRDAVRERDAARINEAVLEIVNDGVIRMNSARKADSSKAFTESEEVVDWGIRTFGSYVGWIDINLTVTPTTVPLLFNLLADPSNSIRLATCAAIQRIVAKGLKEPSDKLQLLKVLSLGEVLDALEAKTREQQAERGEETDEGEESYREALGKLLNTLGLELIKLDECEDEVVRSEALSYLNLLLPVTLRFLADEYDDTSCTIFLFLQNVLAGYKKMRKADPSRIDDSKRSFLTSLMQIILLKMKWDEEADPEDLDDDDVAEFEQMRKHLRSFLDSILVIDQQLVVEAIQTLAMNTISAYRNGVALKWTDAELGVYLVYIFAEISKSGGKGRAAFCYSGEGDKAKSGGNVPESSLTPLGQLLFALVQSDLCSFSHRAVSLLYFESMVRYAEFFKVRRDCLATVLEAMVDSRGIHNTNKSFRLRLYYLFHRFIKENRTEVPADICPTLSASVRDLLTIEVNIPDPEEIETDLLTDAVKDTTFDSQLYLYETLGICCAAFSKDPEQQTSLLLTSVKPLMDELSTCIQEFTKGGQDVTPVVKTHHIVMALGNITKGFPDFPSPTAGAPTPTVPAADVFVEVAQAILYCLEVMNVYKVMRDAARFAFARILATAGPHVTHFIPILMSRLLTHFEPSELVDFMNFIGLLIHKLENGLFSVLDELIGPLSLHISTLLTTPISGSDDLLTQTETKKAYLALLNNIMAAKLYGIFISPRNNPSFEALLDTMQRIAKDSSDPSSQKTAFLFLTRCVGSYGMPVTSPTAPTMQNGASSQQTGLPGFERIIYEQLVPTAFAVPSSPDFNPKDGQTIAALQEIAAFLHAVARTRGIEAYDFFMNVFLPSQNWPPDMAADFTSRLRNMDLKNFRKYFTDVVRNSKSGS